MGEIALLEKVEMKLAFCDTEDALSRQLSILLCPVLLKLASPDKIVVDKVRFINKVLTILTHISKRLKSTTIELPVQSLLNLYNSEHTNLVKSFALLYLEMSFNSTHSLLIPALIHKIHEKPASQQLLVFGIALPFMSQFTEEFCQKFPDDPFQFQSTPLDLLFLLDAILDIMMYDSLNTKNIKSNSGISSQKLSFISNNGKAEWMNNSLKLKELKVNLIKMLLIDKIIPQKEFINERYLIYTVASADLAHEVQFVGEDGIKRMEKPDFESIDFIERLFSIYQGSQNIMAYRAPAKIMLRKRILDVLCKSIAATNIHPQMIEVAFDALNGPDTIAKLRSSGMAFIQWIARMVDRNKLNVIAPSMLTGLLRLIDEEGNKQNELLRGFAYESIGLISKRAPHLFSMNPSFLFRVFEALSVESKAICGSIQDALGLLIPAYIVPAQESAFASQVLDAIAKMAHKDDHRIKYISAKCAQSIFPFSNIRARFLCLLLASDQKLEVRDEAMIGLGFPDYVQGEQYLTKLPVFEDFVSFILEYINTAQRGSNDSLKTGGINTNTLVMVTYFARQLLIKTIDHNAVISPLSCSFDIQMQPVSNAVRSNLQSKLSSVRLISFIELLRVVLSATESDGLLQAVASTTLLEITSMSKIPEFLITNKDWIYNFIKTPKLETRVSMSHLFGIVVTFDLENLAARQTFDLYFSKLLAASLLTQSSEYYTRHGAIMGLGFLVGRVAYRFPQFNDFIQDIQIVDVLQILIACIESPQTELVIAGCISLAEIGRYSSLAAQMKSALLVAKIQEQLKKLVKSSRESKVQESAIFAIGHFAVGNFDLVENVVEFLLGLPTDLSKQSELNFDIGDSLCACIAGFSSLHMARYMDVADANLSSRLFQPLTSDKIEGCVQKIISLTSPLQSSVTRKAACVWILCLTKNCGTSEGISKYLLRFHDAFSSLLGDNDDFVQEIASKGIGLIYDIGDQGLKDQLVQNLISTFTDGKKIAPQSVSASTEIFNSNVLGNTPDGSNISSYQSILSLASDMNQPDLVYKFMSLASHHAVWNSRRGASMGFSSISEQAEKELKPHLPKLVPRLYRYQFDPHPKTATGMKNIWKSLVKDSNGTIDELFGPILDEIKVGFGDKMWRTREASCLALADLLHGRQFSQLESHMRSLWAMIFRVLDDIKESVRKSAFVAAKSLTNLTVRYCDPVYHSLSKSQKIMDDIIPFFLNQGLGNSAEEVRQFSLATILKLCKTGGILLKPHIGDIIITFLESLSSLEPQMMNYLSFHTAAYNFTQDQLDTSRLSAAKSSPIMDAIYQCVPYFDTDVLATFVPRFCIVVRKGIGLPTRAGCARLCYILCQQLPNEITLYADLLLKALTIAIYDRNPVVRKTFSAAIGHVARLSTSGAFDILTSNLEKHYLDANDEDGRSVAPITLLEISRNAPSHAATNKNVILPLAFMGMSDTSSPILAEVWKQVWEENTGGTSNAIKQWKDELFFACKNVLKNNPTWSMKRQVGKSLTIIAQSLGPEITSIMDDCLELLLESLSGRTWDGKIAVLEALMAVCIEGVAYFQSRKDQGQLVENVFIREASKKNLEYRRQAIEYLGLTFEALKSSRFSECRDFLVEVATGSENQDGMDIDDDDDRQKPLLLSIQANAFKALGQTFSCCVLQQGCIIFD